MTADNNNDEQIEYWNGKAGQTWVRSMDRIDGMMAPITQALLARAAVAPGERAVDVGCGCGSTTLALAQRGALVFGIDVSEPMLALAKERATGLQGIAFRRTDAATQPFTPDHELVFSRFGVMFFANPSTRSSNLRTGLTAERPALLRLLAAAWRRTPGWRPPARPSCPSSRSR